MGPQSAGAALLSRGIQLTFGATANIAVPGIVSGASGAGFVKQGDPIAVREMSTNAAALSPRKLRFDSPFSRASFSSPGGALARSGGECPKTRTNADSVAAAIAHILSFALFEQTWWATRARGLGGPIRLP